MKKRSLSEVTDAFQTLSGVKKNQASDVGSQRDIQQTPDLVIDSPIGTRDAILKRINPNATDGFTHEILFPETNTTTWARVSSSGIISTPKGSWVNGYFVISETKVVHASIIKDTLQWEIKGEEAEINEKTISSNSTVIKKGDTVFEVNEEKARVTIGDTLFVINSNGVFVNGKKVCVEPCSSSPPVALWSIVADSVWVYYEDGIWVFDQKSGKWVNHLSIPNIMGIDYFPQENGEDIYFVQSPDKMGTINEFTGSAVIQKTSSYDFERIFYMTRSIGGFGNDFAKCIPVYNETKYIDGVEVAVENFDDSYLPGERPPYFDLSSFSKIMGGALLKNKYMPLGGSYQEVKFTVIYGEREGKGVVDVYSFSDESDLNNLTFIKTIELSGIPLGPNYPHEWDNGDLYGSGSSGVNTRLYISTNNSVDILSFETFGDLTLAKTIPITVTGNFKYIRVDDGDYNYHDEVLAVTGDTVTRIDATTFNILGTKIYSNPVVCFETESITKGENHGYYLTTKTFGYDDGSFFTYEVPLPQENPLGFTISTEIRSV